MRRCTTTPYPDNPEEPRGSTRQGQQRHFVFDRRKLRRTNVVPAPVAAIALGLAVATAALPFSNSIEYGIAAMACTIAVPVLIQARARPAMYHDSGRGVLCVRKGVSWRLLAGFRCTRLPTNVDGNQKRLVRNLHGIDPKVTFKVVVARHEFTRESRARAGSWFAPKGDITEELGAGESGHAWFLVLERPVNLLFGLNHEIEALARARDAARTMFPNTYPHHQFRAATSDELALATAW